MKAFLARLVPKNIAAILGVIGVLIPLVREFVMVGLRIVAVFYSKAEEWIEPAGDIFDKIQDIWDTIKNFFLDSDGS